MDKRNNELKKHVNANALTRTHLVEKESLEALEKQAAKVAKMCNENGFPFRFEVIGEKSVFVTDPATGESTEKQLAEVLVEGYIKADGWAVAAVLIKEEKGNIVLKNQDMSVDIPSDYFKGLHCDECHHHKVKKLAFVLYNEETGQFQMVGRGCLEKFTKGLSPTKFLKLQEFKEALAEAEEEVMAKRTYDKSDKHIIDTALYMLCCAKDVIANGYKAGDLSVEDSTARQGQIYYEGFMNMIKNGLTVDHFLSFIGKEALELARQNLAWLDRHSDIRVEIHNFKVVSSSKRIYKENMPVLANLFFDKSLEDENWPEGNMWLPRGNNILTVDHFRPVECDSPTGKNQYALYLASGGKALYRTAMEEGTLRDILNEDSGKLPVRAIRKLSVEGFGICHQVTDPYESFFD